MTCSGAPFGELTFAHLTAAILRRLRPRFAGIAVTDVDAAQGECPLDVGQMPKGRVGSRFVVAQEVKEDTFRLHLDRHVGQRRAGRPSACPYPDGPVDDDPLANDPRRHGPADVLHQEPMGGSVWGIAT
jgi:hypothetical protein